MRPDQGAPIMGTGLRRVKSSWKWTEKSYRSLWAQQGRVRYDGTRRPRLVNRELMPREKRECHCRPHALEFFHNRTVGAAGHTNARGPRPLISVRASTCGDQLRTVAHEHAALHARACGRTQLDGALQIETFSTRTPRRAETTRTRRERRPCHGGQCWSGRRTTGIPRF